MYLGALVLAVVASLGGEHMLDFRDCFDFIPACLIYTHRKAMRKCDWPLPNKGVFLRSLTANA